MVTLVPSGKELDGYGQGLEEDLLYVLYLFNNVNITNLVYKKELLEIVSVTNNPYQQIARKYNF